MQSSPVQESLCSLYNDVKSTIHFAFEGIEFCLCKHHWKSVFDGLQPVQDPVNLRFETAHFAFETVHLAFETAHLAFETAHLAFETTKAVCVVIIRSEVLLQPNDIALNLVQGTLDQLMLSLMRSLDRGSEWPLGVLLSHT